MSRKSENPKHNIITFKMSDRELDQLQSLVKGYGSSSRGDIIRLCINYAVNHPYQVLTTHEAHA